MINYIMEFIVVSVTNTRHIVSLVLTIVIIITCDNML